MHFAIYTEDNDGALPIRKANREAHLAYLEGFDVVTGGPILDDAGDMVGSVVILNAVDMAAAEDYSANDPYRLAGLPKLTKIWAWKQSVGRIALS